MEKESFVESTLIRDDYNFEIPLRPQSLTDFIGQEEVKERLEVVMGAAKQRKEALGHCLLFGPPGLGKTTLAHIMAKTMESTIVVTSGPMLERPGDLAGLLTNLQRGDILFVDEIHRMHRSVEEYLYPAMEDFSLDVLLDTGPNARSLHMKLNPFTLVGATTRSGAITAPLRSRFPLSLRLDYYSTEILEKIIARTTHLLKLTIDRDGKNEIAKRSRGTPRTANHLVRFVRDYAQMKAGNVIDQSVVQKALAMLSIDEKGLDEMDKKLLSLIIEHHSGGPVGLSTLAVGLGEEGQTIEEVYEPFLILQGFLKRTPRGRVATDLAYHHLGKKRGTLF